MSNKDSRKGKGAKAQRQLEQEETERTENKIIDLRSLWFRLFMIVIGQFEFVFLRLSAFA